MTSTMQPAAVTVADELYTKNGAPMTLRGDDLFDRTGQHVAHRHGDKVYAFGGRYAATIIGDRLVHRACDDITTAPPFIRRTIAASARAHRPGVSLPGHEPFEHAGYQEPSQRNPQRPTGYSAASARANDR